MDHTGERRQHCIGPGEHGIERCGIRHIGEFHLDPEPPGAQRLDRLFGGRIRRPATVQHHHARAVLGEPFGERAADTAKAPRHQIGGILAQLPRPERVRCEHDLPDVSCCAHVAHRGTRLREWPSGVHERRELT